MRAPPGAGWSSLAARRAHNPKVAGSNPAPATICPYLSSCLSRSHKRGEYRCVERVEPLALRVVQQADAQRSLVARENSPEVLAA